MGGGMKRLHLHEEVLLLALRDDKGTPAHGAWHQQAIAAAVVAELLMQGRLGVEDSGRKQLLHALGDVVLGHELLDDFWAQVRDAPKPAALKTWLGRFAVIRDLRERAARNLVDRGILRRDERTVLLLFKRTVYPEADGRPEEEIIGRLERALYTEEPVDPGTAVLLSVADATGLLGLTFPRKELKQLRERIAQVVNGEAIGKATREQIAAVQTATLVAAVIPSMVVVTIASN